jgi:hypothetical protein
MIMIDYTLYLVNVISLVEVFVMLSLVDIIVALDLSMLLMYLMITL